MGDDHCRNIANHRSSQSRDLFIFEGVPDLTRPMPVTKLAAVVESSLPNPANAPNSKNGEFSSSSNDTRRRARVIGIKS